MRFLDRVQPLALLVMRLTLGAIMVAHGRQKLFHGGAHSIMQAITSWGWPGWLAWVVTYVEFAGGILLILGVLTRLLGLAYTIEMSVAIWKVHWNKGFIGPGSIEFPLAIGTIAFALICFGAGPFSVDHWWTGRGGRAKAPSRK